MSVGYRINPEFAARARDAMTDGMMPRRKLKSKELVGLTARQTLKSSSLATSPAGSNISARHGARHMTAAHTRSPASESNHPELLPILQQWREAFDLEQESVVPELTAEEQVQIGERTIELANQASGEQLKSIVDEMSPNLVKSLEAQQLDPIIHHFRMLATAEHRERQRQTRRGHEFKKSLTGATSNDFDTASPTTANSLRDGLLAKLGKNDELLDQKAAALITITAEEDLRAILKQMDPTQKQNLIAKNIDLLLYHFKMLATRDLRAQQGKSPDMIQPEQWPVDGIIYGYGTVAPPAGLLDFTREEGIIISQWATERANATSPDEQRAIVEQMGPDRRQSLRETGIDPIMHHFCLLAAIKCRDQKMRKWEQEGKRHLVIPFEQPHAMPRRRNNGKKARSNTKTIHYTLSEDLSGDAGMLKKLAILKRRCVFDIRERS